MEKIRIQKNKLKDKIEENRSHHIDNYNEAHKLWIDNHIKSLEKALKESIDTNKVVVPSYSFEPSSHQEDYNSIIQVLEFSLDDTISLSHQEFNKYVMDQWDWKQTFNDTNSLYTNKLYK